MDNKKDFFKMAQFLSFKKALRHQLKYFKENDIEHLDDNDFQNFISEKENNIPTDNKGYINFEKIEKDERS